MEIQEMPGALPAVAVENLAFPLRANVGFSLEGELDLYTRALNAILVAHGHVEINFTRGCAVPHFTLLMGKVGDQIQLRRLMEAVAHFTDQHDPVEFDVSAPHFSDKDEGYIFLNVIPQGPFRDLRLALHTAVNGFLDCEPHGGPTNVSHITVGYAGTVGFNIKELENLPKPATRGIARVIQITEVGARGTCKRLITDAGGS
jgi:hypothetical protein